VALLAPVLRAFAGGRLFGGRTGQETPRVLALHGWRRDHRDFNAVLGGEGYGELEALAVDLPGFGGTPPPEEPWGSARYAEAVAPVFHDMAPPVVLLGHSFGGRVALHLTLQHPETVGGVVLTAVPLLRLGGSRRSPLGFRVARQLHRLGLVGETRMEAARQRYGSPDYRAASGIMRQVFVTLVQETYEDELSALSCPVVMVWGEEDTETPVAIGRRAAELPRRCRLEELPGVGHLTPLEAPGALRRAVTSLLP
jgi:pimeloyl-ACP methyl ester carboxylesterase